MNPRNFSDFEKDVIRRMLEIDANMGFLVLNNLLATGGGNSLLPYDCYIDLEAENKVTIKVRKEHLKGSNQEVFKEVDWKVSKIIISVTDLFRHLEETGMIILYGNYNAKAIGNKWQNEPYQTCNFIDDDLMPRIYQLARRRVFVSESLRKLVEDKFLTQEEIRHNEEMASAQRSLKISWVANGVAIVGLISSLLIPLFKSDSVTIANKSLAGVVEIPELRNLQAMESTHQKGQDEIEAAISQLESSMVKSSTSNNSEVIKLREDITGALGGIRNVLKSLNAPEKAASETDGDSGIEN
jgi:hypothetical protein